MENGKLKMREGRQGENEMMRRKDDLPFAGADLQSVPHNANESTDCKSAPAKNWTFSIFNFQLSILFSFFLLSSCEDYVTGFEIKDKQTKLVLNGFISPDTLAIHLSKSLSINQSITSGDDVNVSNATVTLYEDNNRIGEMDYVGFADYGVSLGYYTIKGFAPKTGVKYRVEASASGLPGVYAEAIIPDAPEMIKIDTVSSRRKDDYGNDWVFDITAKISNTKTRQNYYGFSAVAEKLYNLDFSYPYFVRTNLRLYALNSQAMFFREYSYSTPNMDENWLSGFSLFNSDKDILTDALEMKFFLSCYDLSYNSDTLILNISMYDKALYTHLFSLAKRNSLDEGDFFSEQVSVYSNVHNGLGIFGAFNTFQYKIDTRHYSSNVVYY